MHCGQTLTIRRYNLKFVYFWKLIKLKFLSYLSDNFSVSQQIIQNFCSVQLSNSCVWCFTSRWNFPKNDVTRGNFPSRFDVSEPRPSSRYQLTALWIKLASLADMKFDSTPSQLKWRGHIVQNLSDTSTFPSDSKLILSNLKLQYQKSTL